MQKIRVKNRFSNDHIAKIKGLLARPISSILIGGNFGIYYSRDIESKCSIYSGNEIALLFQGENRIESLSLRSTLISRDDYGEFDHIHADFVDFDRSREPFGVEQKMLLRNRGIFYYSLVNEPEVHSLDVYGVYADNYEATSGDFPEEGTTIFSDIDLLVKANVALDKPFTLHAKGGEMHLVFYDDVLQFENFISESGISGSPLDTLVHKYSISKGE